LRPAAWTAAALVACALLPARLTAGPAVDQPAAATVSRYPTAEEIAQHTRDYSWILLSKGETTHRNAWGEDAALARRQRHGSEPLLWVRRAGEQLVIRDPAVIARASDVFARMKELESRRAELARQQAELGRRLSEVSATQQAAGMTQNALGALQADTSTRQAAWNAKQPNAGLAPSDAAALQGVQHETADQMRAYEAEARALAGQADALRQPMEDLAKQMQPLARQQQDLGAQMETLAAQAEADMRRLIDEAMAAGKGERVD
jgi:hypothetical protein